MTVAWAEELVGQTEVRIVTPEESPQVIFGSEASESIAASL